MIRPTVCSPPTFPTNAARARTNVRVDPFSTKGEYAVDSSARRADGAPPRRAPVRRLSEPPGATAAHPVGHPRGHRVRVSRGPGDRRRPAGADLSALLGQLHQLCGRFAAHGIGRVTGSASGSRPARPTCTWRSWRCWPSAPRTCRWTSTIPTSAPRPCSTRPGCARSSERPPDGLRPVAPRGPDRGGPGPRTTRGSSSPRGRPAHPRASRSPTAAPRPSSTPRRGCFSSTRRSAPATGCSRGCPSRSTPPARRCGWPGAMAHASCLPRGRWSRPARTWVPGWCDGGSRWCRRCRRSRRCGRPRSCAASGS